MANVTHTPAPFNCDDPSAADELLLVVYDELRKLARARMACERADHTLQPTALVHEAYLRLAGSHGWTSRGHFFAAAAEAMSRILIEYARQKGAEKRGGKALQINLEECVPGLSLSLDDMLDLHEALSRLDAVDSQAASIVKLRMFAGLSVEEAAASLGVPARSAYRDWAFAQAWLFRELNRPSV